jgi:uncharacterized protein YfaT (DUF1175 family)
MTALRAAVIALCVVGANADFTDFADLQKPTLISQISQINYLGWVANGGDNGRSPDFSAQSDKSALAFADASDRAAFRSWFVLLADVQFEQRADEVTDCAALVRFAYREALRAHTPEWARRVRLPIAPAFPDVRSGPRAGPGGWPLFRVTPGEPGRHGEFVDARTLIALNTRRLGRDTRALAPGDLLYFQQPGQTQPDHVMVFIGRSLFDPDHDDWVVYHTGPNAGGAGEVRKVRLLDLAAHPSVRWRPTPSNPRFLGVFRLAVL